MINKYDPKDHGWVHIMKSGAEIWVGGKKCKDGRFQIGGMDFEIAGNLPPRAEIYIKPVVKPQTRRSWEE